MLVIDARVQSIIRECEDRIRQVTQNNSITVLLFSKKIELKLSFEDIVDFVCGVTGETARDVMKKSRKVGIVTARHLIIYYSFHYCNLSKSEISRRFDQDHTTIISALSKVDDLLQAGDKIICNYINDINNIIQSLTLSYDRPPTTRTPDGDCEAEPGSTKHVFQGPQKRIC